MKIFVIVFLVIFVFVVFWLFKFYFDKKFLVKEFNRCNVSVEGAKGTGKDVLFHTVILKNRKPYLSNVDYGGKFEEITLKDLELAKNDYNNFINGNVEIVNKINRWENKHIFISDAGIILPSHFDSQLSKTYKTLPIVMALQRHLYNSNFHTNTQAHGRVWVKLREQGDAFFYVRETKKLLGFLPFLLTKCIYYSEFNSAKQRLLPMKARGLKNDYNRALIEQHKATYGDIKVLFIVNRIKNIKYDNRIYHKKLFGITANEWKKEQRLLDKNAKNINKSFKEKFIFRKKKVRKDKN